MRPIRVPLRRKEVWARWLELSAELGLHPGEPADLFAVRHPIGAADPANYKPQEVERLLDRMVRQARRRRPLYRLDLEAAAIVVDPLGTVDNLADLAPRLRALAGERHRAAVVADSEASDLPRGRVAHRWAITRRTLQRWRWCVKKTPPVSQEAPKPGVSVAA